MKNRWEIWVELVSAIIVWGAIAGEIAIGWENIKRIKSLQFTIVLFIVIIATLLISALNLKSKAIALFQFYHGRTYVRYVLQAEGYVKTPKSFH